MARKNQMANGIEAKMPPQVAVLKVLLPAQPLAVKLVQEKPGDTTPINTSNSPMAIMVTNSSKLAAMCMPRILSVINTTYAPTAASLGSSPGNCTFK